MPWRCYVVLLPAQTTAPNLRPPWRVAVDRMGFRAHPLRNASAAFVRLSYRPSGSFRASPPVPPRSTRPTWGW